MSAEPAVQLQHYRHEDLPAIRQTLVDLHAHVYADQMQDPFVQKFPWFVDHWGSKPEFACVMGYDAAGEPVGYCYGAPAAQGREWWREHLETAPADPSTFAVSELMVRKEWRKTGTARRLHETVLDSRNEALAVISVDVTHPGVLALYESWGYRKVGEDRDFADSPLYAVMLRDLCDRGGGAGNAPETDAGAALSRVRDGRGGGWASGIDGRRGCRV